MNHRDYKFNYCKNSLAVRKIWTAKPNVVPRFIINQSKDIEDVTILNCLNKRLSLYDLKNTLTKYTKLDTATSNLIMKTIEDLKVKRSSVKSKR